MGSLKRMFVSWEDEEGGGDTSWWDGGGDTINTREIVSMRKEGRGWFKVLMEAVFFLQSFKLNDLDLSSFLTQNKYVLNLSWMKSAEMNESIP